MTVVGELRNLEKVQDRLVRFSNYLEKHHKGHYDDLAIKISCVIGSIEDALNYDSLCQ